MHYISGDSFVRSLFCLMLRDIPPVCCFLKESDNEALISRTGGVKQTRSAERNFDHKCQSYREPTMLKAL